MRRCYRVFSVVVVGALAAVLITAGVAVARRHAPAKTSVTVNAKEFSFALSRKSVPTGAVAFNVVNKGKIKHDFKIAGKKTPSLKPGKKATLVVTFAKKGRYPYVCTIDSHKKFGMKGVLTVR
jgi:uncharacterized cupredoxin-like copper-binding protein